MRPRLVLVAALVAVGIAAVVAATTRSGSTASPVAPSGPLPGELTSRAPWPANNGRDLRARLTALGLPALSQEGTVLHTHQHLDLFVAGRRVVVPAGLGIDADGQFIAPIHTHDDTGIIHVESPTVRTFTLGEFFGVWGVRFDSSCLGAYCAGGGSALRVYADGQPVSHPGLLPLTAHEEIVVAFGTPGQLPRPLPSSYDFPPGL